MSELKMYTPLQTEPVKTDIVCRGKKLDVFEVNVSGEEYEKCEYHSTDMWANEKTGQFGLGLANSKDDPRKVERNGNFGELAFSKLFALPVDFSYKKGGDDQDFMLFGASVNIKNAIRNYESGLIRAITDKGYKLQINNNVYVFSFTKNENKELKQATIIIVGYEIKENILKRKIVPARKGDHKNYDIPYEELKPISKLYDLYFKNLN